MGLTNEEKNIYESLLIEVRNQTDGDSLSELCIMMLKYLPQIKQKRIRLSWIQQINVYTKEIYKMNAMYYHNN